MFCFLLGGLCFWHFGRWAFFSSAFRFLLVALFLFVFFCLCFVFFCFFAFCILLFALPPSILLSRLRGFISTCAYAVTTGAHRDVSVCAHVPACLLRPPSSWYPTNPPVYAHASRTLPHARGAPAHALCTYMDSFSGDIVVHFVANLLIREAQPSILPYTTTAEHVTQQ